MMVSNCLRCQIFLFVMMLSNCLRCQIVRCVKSSAVSNCPRCQIVLLALVVSNCPTRLLGVKLSQVSNYPITKRNNPNVGLIRKTKKEKSLRPRFHQGDQRKGDMSQRAFFPSQFFELYILFSTCMYTTFLLSPLLSSVLGIGVKEKDCQRHIVMWLSAFTVVSSASKYRPNLSFKTLTKLQFQNQCIALENNHQWQGDGVRQN